MKPQTPHQKRNNQDRQESAALWKVTALFAIVVGLTAGNVTAATVTLVDNNFDTSPYTAVAQSSFSSTNVGIPNTDDFKIEDGLAFPGSPSGLGMNGVQVVTWAPSSPYNSGNAILLRPNTAFRCNLNPRGGTNYTWEFSMLSSKSGSADRGFRVSIVEEGADQNEQDFLIFRSGQASTTNNLSIGGLNIDGVDIIQAFDGRPGKTWTTMSNTVAGTPSFVTNNVWAHYKIVADAVARTFSYYVNDMTTPVCTGYSVSRPQNLPVSAIRFANEGNSADDGYTLIDNVSLTVDGNFIDLATGPFAEGFEGYNASNVGNTNSADNNPGGAWVTCETSGIGNGNTITPTKVQVVDSTVTAPHSGNNCLMVSQGQTAGATISWAQATNEDVKITWWAKVPVTPNNNTIASVYLRVSLYGWEVNSSSASDTVLIGFGHRSSAPYGGANSVFTFSRWASTWFGNGGLWEDTGTSYTPDTWEQYQLTTRVSQNSFSVSNLTQGISVVRDGQFITSWVACKKMHTLAFSTSNNSTPGGNPPAYVDDITIEPYTNPDTTPIQPRPYTPSITGSRFTNYTVLNLPGKSLGGVCVDPRDNTSILITIDQEVNGGIIRAHKIASGNWVLDPTPIVSSLREEEAYACSCKVNTNGDLWWVHDNRKGVHSQSLRRLKAPWTSNPVEEIISDFGAAPVNAQDQPCDLVFVPSTFTGTVPQLAVLDRGVNGNNPNAIWLVDPATSSYYQYSYLNALAGPDNLLFGDGLGGNANAIDAIPATGELATIWEGDGVNDNGVISVFNGSGGVRYILTAGSGVTFGSALAVDPLTQRIWVADQKTIVTPSAFTPPQIVSFDSTNGTFTQEINFPNNNPSTARPDLRINFHDPGMTFSPDGSFLVVVDQTLASDGGRLVIFDNEPFVIPPITVTIVSSGGCQNLTWTSGGAVNYVVQSTSSLSPTVSWTTISPVLTGTSYTDCSAAPKYYRVVAFPQN